MRNIPYGATVYGIDLGKNNFHAVGVDNSGKFLQRVTLNRTSIFHFFAKTTSVCSEQSLWILLFL